MTLTKTFFGNAASDRQQNVVVNEGNVDQEFTATNSDTSLTTNWNLVKVQSLEGCFKEKIDKETSDIVATVQERIQMTISTAFDNIITPRI